MDSPELRRRRKKSTRTSPRHFLLLIKSYLFSVRCFRYCFGFLCFILMLSYTIRLNSSSFKPVLVVPHFPLLSSRSDSSVIGFDKFLSLPSIENRVLLPDHVLLFVNNGGFVEKLPELTCVYSRSSSNSSSSSSEIIRLKAISVDDYDEFRLIVRCQLPPENFSPVVDLISQKQKVVQRRLKVENKPGMVFNQSIYSWENLTYEATLDRNNIVVFAKGLNTRAGRDSDPSMFRCHFRFRDFETGLDKQVSTRAIAAAQEVVRCYLPASLKNSSREGEEIRVAIGTTHRVNGRARGHTVSPSVARVFTSRVEEVANEKDLKHELCVCSMVWNQAAMLREWIMYHSWLGVEKWFIYDNNSDDDIKNVVEELNEYNVSRHVWPWVKTQEAGFSHCALRAKKECRWVSFMDVDEFFYFPYITSGHHSSGRWPYAGQNGLRALVSNYSSSSTRIAELRTNCYSFGPSGLTSPPVQGVTAGYTCRLQSPERHKSIIRPQALDSTLLNMVHHFRLRKGFTYLNLPLSTAVINHYKYQVWDVFKAKFHRRVATYVADWQEKQNEGSRDRAPGLGTEAIEPLGWSRKFCENWDTGMHDFVLTNLADRSTGLLPWERERERERSLDH